MAGLSDLCFNGVALPYHGQYSILLAPCSASFYQKLAIGQATTASEIEEGLLKTPCLGLPLTPMKISPRAIATVFKGDKIKDRCVVSLAITHDELSTQNNSLSTHTNVCTRPQANLGYPQKEGQQMHSVNDGFDMTNEEFYPNIDYITPTSIAQTMGILIPVCGDDFVLARNDWSRW